MSIRSEILSSLEIHIIPSKLWIQIKEKNNGMPDYKRYETNALMIIKSYYTKNHYRNNVVLELSIEDYWTIVEEMSNIEILASWENLKSE